MYSYGCSCFLQTRLGLLGCWTQGAAPWAVKGRKVGWEMGVGLPKFKRRSGAEDRCLVLDNKAWS